VIVPFTPDIRTDSSATTSPGLDAEQGESKEREANSQHPRPPSAYNHRHDSGYPSETQQRYRYNINRKASSA
jgi:hypothetical protein